MHTRLRHGIQRGAQTTLSTPVGSSKAITLPKQESSILPINTQNPRTQSGRIPRLWKCAGTAIHILEGWYPLHAQTHVDQPLPAAYNSATFAVTIRNLKDGATGRTLITVVDDPRTTYALNRFPILLQTRPETNPHGTHLERQACRGVQRSVCAVCLFTPGFTLPLPSLQGPDLPDPTFRNTF